MALLKYRGVISSNSPSFPLRGLCMAVWIGDTLHHKPTSLFTIVAKEAVKEEALLHIFKAVKSFAIAL